MSQNSNDSNDSGPVAMIVITVLYLAFIVYIFLININPSLELSEVGDYIAGVTAPIVFLWLIYGYFMQRKELALQRNEFKRYADDSEYRSMIERSHIQPNFTKVEVRSMEGRLGMTIILGQLDGKTIFNPFAVSSPTNYVTSINIDSKNNIWIRVDMVPIIDVSHKSNFKNDFKLILTYTDLTNHLTECVFGNGSPTTPYGAPAEALRRKNGHFQLLSINYTKKYQD